MLTPKLWYRFIAWPGFVDVVRGLNDMWILFLETRLCCTFDSWLDLLVDVPFAPPLLIKRLIRIPLFFYGVLIGKGVQGIGFWFDHSTPPPPPPRSSPAYYGPVRGSWDETWAFCSEIWASGFVAFNTRVNLWRLSKATFKYSWIKKNNSSGLAFLNIPRMEVRRNLFLPEILIKMTFNKFHQF